MLNFFNHIIVIHFPITLLFFEFVLLCLWVYKKDPAYLRFARINFIAGFIFLILSMISGFMDMEAWGGFNGVGRTHYINSIGTLYVYIFRGAYWKWADPKEGYYQKYHLFTALIGTLLILLTGYTGGRLIHS
ncbi:MAG: putative membrane protein [Candidatus Omnitrophota bacterium]|jgi:uncharacterized membrane protein